MAWNEWVTVGISVAAAAFAAWQAWEARRARKDSKTDAEAAKTAAEASAAALKQLADLERAREEKVLPPWRIEHSRRIDFRLVNDGEEMCRDVELFYDGGGARFDKPEVQDVSRRAGVTFSFARFASTPPGAKLRVRWHLDRHPEPLEWSDEIPPPR